MSQFYLLRQQNKPKNKKKDSKMIDLSKIFEQLVNLWWLIPLSIFAIFIKTPFFKGLIGELIVKIAANIMLDKKIYHQFHNITLSNPDGTTQIDHIFVSKFGIFVVETKNMKGFIFGNPNNSMWTQQIFKVKNKFQNPIHQNYKHTQAIKNHLNIESNAIIPLVAFVGDCKFKTSIPDNITKGIGFIEYIKRKKEVLLTEKQISHSIEAIKSGNLSSQKTKKEHIERLQSRSDKDSRQLCPKCGSEMILRTSRTSKNQFWGCSRYPACKTTRRINN